MAACPKCGEEVGELAFFCSRCGTPLRSGGLGPTSTSAPDGDGGSFAAPAGTGDTRLVALGFISAFLALLVLPEAFGSVAVVLGAYIWRKERGSRGLIIILLALAFMVVGIYFTSFIELGDMLS